jgi:hypothetical protein
MTRRTCSMHSDYENSITSLVKNGSDHLVGIYTRTLGEG